MRLYLAALYRNLVAGTRLALFLPVRALDFRVSPLHYSLLIAFNFVVWLLAAALRTGAEGEFDTAAPAIYLASIPLVLLTAAVVVAIYGAAERLLLIATALTASDALFELIALVVPSLAVASGFPRVAILLLLA